MTPEQLSILANLLSVLKLMSGWPFGLLIFLTVVGPWVMALIIVYVQKKRFESAINMYKSNVKLVDSYEDLAKDLKEVVIMNTTAMTKLGSDINRNQFCPMVRLEKKEIGVKG